MPVISDTAYPSLSAGPGATELEAFTPEAAELAFARQRTRQPGPRLALLVLLKAFQRLGYAVRLADMSPVLVAHVAASASLAGDASEVASYDAVRSAAVAAALPPGRNRPCVRIRRGSSPWSHSIDFVRPGGTRIMCNPAGPGFSNLAFRDDLVVEV